MPLSRTAYADSEQGSMDHPGLLMACRSGLAEIFPGSAEVPADELTAQEPKAELKCRSSVTASGRFGQQPMRSGNIVAGEG